MSLSARNSTNTHEQQVMRNFSVHTLYVFHEALSKRESEERLHRALNEPAPATFIMSDIGRGDGVGTSKGKDVTDGGGGNLDTQGALDHERGDVGVRKCARPPLNRLRLDVPELFADLDSRQV